MVKPFEEWEEKYGRAAEDISFRWLHDRHQSVEMHPFGKKKRGPDIVVTNHDVAVFVEVARKRFFRRMHFCDFDKWQHEDRSIVHVLERKRFNLTNFLPSVFIMVNHFGTEALMIEGWRILASPVRRMKLRNESDSKLFLVPTKQWIFLNFIPVAGVPLTVKVEGDHIDLVSVPMSGSMDQPNTPYCRGKYPTHPTERRLTPPRVSVQNRTS